MVNSLSYIILVSNYFCRPILVNELFFLWFWSFRYKSIRSIIKCHVVMVLKLCFLYRFGLKKILSCFLLSNYLFESFWSFYLQKSLQTLLFESKKNLSCFDCQTIFSYHFDPFIYKKVKSVFKCHVARELDFLTCGKNNKIFNTSWININKRRRNRGKKTICIISNYHDKLITKWGLKVLIYNTRITKWYDKDDKPRW